MNNLLKRSAILYLGVSFFLYLGGSFVGLSFNPADWEEGVRFVLWVVSVICTFFLIPFMKDE
jgi:hypothetical protein